ncbi:MAG TPA: sigma-70 family RNA polymerase sigma factor [Acidimicrobiales bacterium]|jgi:RNA polymerase sigma factor (sigma-70 family)
MLSPQPHTIPAETHGETVARNGNRRSTTEVPSAELLVRAAKGDQRAWDAIVNRYSGLVWSVCRSCGLNQADAAEVSQTTWLRMVQHVDSIRQPERLGAWLSMTARRESWRIHRQSGRTVLVEETDLFEGVQAPSAEVDRGLLDAERRDALEEAFLTLSPHCQRVMRMLMTDPAPSYAEVAAALDMPVGSIGPTRGRCLSALRDRLLELSER